MAAGSAGGSVGGTVGGGVTGGGITGGGVTGGGVTGGPAKTTRPILLLLDSVNQRLPSAPSVIPIGPLPGVATANSAMSPVGVIRPTLLPQDSVNQRLPSGPAVMPSGLLLPLGGQLRLGGRGNSVRSEEHTSELQSLRHLVCRLLL